MKSLLYIAVLVTCVQVCTCCICQPITYVDKFCGSDFVVKAYVRAGPYVLGNNDYGYKILVLEVIRCNFMPQMQVWHEYEITTQRDDCGIELKERRASGETKSTLIPLIIHNGQEMENTPIPPPQETEEEPDEYVLPALTVPAPSSRRPSTSSMRRPSQRRQSSISIYSRRFSIALQNQVTNVGDILKKPGPPDGGYSWVVLFASLMINFLGCIGSTYGVLYIEFLEHFGESNSVTAWPGSINLGLGLAAGPLASIVCKRWGHRICCMLGAVLGLIGLFTSAFATNIWVLYFTFGIVCGLGDCFTYLPATVMPGYYFDKYRNFATCIAVSGLGIGILINPILVEWFVELYTWRGALMIFAALTFNICIFAMLLRPLPGISDQGQEEEISYDVSLLKQWQFLLFVVCDLLWSIGDICMYTVLPDTAYVRGIPKDKAGFLLSNLGISTTIGRVVIAFMASYDLSLVGMYSIGTVISGITMVICALTWNYSVFSVCSVVFGLASGVQFGLGPGITAELFGVSRLTSAYGYLVLGDGIGGFLGPPLAGWMYDITGGYVWALILCGLISFVAAALLALMVIPKLRPELPEVDRQQQMDETITNCPRDSCT